MMKDITTEADVRLLVDAFYAAVRDDQLLNPIFDDVAKIDWTRHLPRMYAFWNAHLLGRSGYVGQPFAAHMKLPVTHEHFVRWLEVFGATVDRHFAGDGAKRAKDMAASFAHALAMRLRVFAGRTDVCEMRSRFEYQEGEQARALPKHCSGF